MPRRGNKTSSLRTEPMIQFVLFTLLVVLTPFMVVTRYLQGAVNELSHLKLPAFGFEIPVIAMSCLLLVVAGLIWQYKEVTKRRAIFASVVLAMVVVSHQVQDLYAGFAIYDLQKNWHYTAYSVYVYIFFRAFNQRKMPKQKMVLYAFITAVGLSIFDETFQLHLSNRVFDVSDIAKDAWGTVMGLILVLFVSETYGPTPVDIRHVWRKRFRDYFDDPFATLLIVWLFALTCVIISPLLTEFSLITYFIGLTVSVVIILFFVLHYLQYKSFRTILLSGILVVVLALGVSFVTHANQQITTKRFGLTVYKGLPIPFFDLLIYSNGWPRLVDKKHFFNKLDKQFLLKQEADIVIVGKGYSGNGGKGFAVAEGSYFVFNSFNKRGTQIILMPTKEACQEFERLKNANKKVLLVLHATC